MQPDADIRMNLNTAPILRSPDEAAVLSLDNLEVGVEADGTVKNVTHFGAFVDIGVGKDALLHISQIGIPKNGGLAKIDHIKLGQRVRVRVIDFDKGRGRINLSLVSD